ncbi:hypothetical protein K458DRAFT_393229 [Lentithecium fluviatile CBS 122367]|uniref:Uncharacterized protein n=1 Tax=Lentithecium fluviatile CBS 122367 TaxID=1168545 RepID=A0A6G1IPU0_9PLEO|nr:hypothetical protein K458DRAFT_393229 [Lentithecium fluviatile CBS 122367]
MFSGQFGPSAQRIYIRKHHPELGLLGEDAPLSDLWPQSPKGRFRGIVADEPQYGLRNESTFHWSVLWADAPQVWLYSSSPAPRGLQDIYNYLKLFERTDLAETASGGDPDRGYMPAMNPFTLVDSHPAAQYRYTSFCFKRWVLENNDLSAY